MLLVRTWVCQHSNLEKKYSYQIDNWTQIWDKFQTADSWYFIRRVKIPNILITDYTISIFILKYFIFYINSGIRKHWFFLYLLFSYFFLLEILNYIFRKMLKEILQTLQVLFNLIILQFWVKFYKEKILTSKSIILSVSRGKVDDITILKVW